MKWVKDLVDGDHIVGQLLVVSATKGTTDKGLNYLNVTFQDKTGTIEAKKWEVSPDEEDEAGERPCHNRKTKPLHQFTAVVGGGDVVEHATFWQIVLGIRRIFTQMTDNVVGMQICGKASDENQYTDNKLR